MMLCVSTDVCLAVEIGWVEVLEQTSVGKVAVEVAGNINGTCTLELKLDTKDMVTLTLKGVPIT